MTSKATQLAFITTEDKAPHSQLFGVDYTVLLPRERSESVEILLERFPPGLAFPLHQHAECEQTYLVLSGKGKVNVGSIVQEVSKGSLIYIPRNTDHSIRNSGTQDFIYIVVATYPDGYLPHEPTWQAHLSALKKHYREN